MVQLSGGDLGGGYVEGDGWLEGTEKVFEGLRYRRVSATQAVFCGVA